VDNSGSDEAQARRAEIFIFEGAVSNFPLTVKEHRATQRVARFALVETGIAALAVPDRITIARLCGIRAGKKKANLILSTPPQLLRSTGS
jgi:hypothetical protein